MKPQPLSELKLCLPCLVANSDCEVDCDVCEKPIAESCIIECQGCAAYAHKHECGEDFYRASGDGCTFCYSDAYDEFWYNVNASDHY